MLDIKSAPERKDFGKIIQNIFKECKTQAKPKQKQTEKRVFLNHQKTQNRVVKKQKNSFINYFNRTAKVIYNIYIFGTRYNRLVVAKRYV
jgi:hypothetical protein